MPNKQSFHHLFINHTTGNSNKSSRTPRRSTMRFAAIPKVSCRVSSCSASMSFVKTSKSKTNFILRPTFERLIWCILARLVLSWVSNGMGGGVGVDNARLREESGDRLHIRVLFMLKSVDEENTSKVIVTLAKRKWIHNIRLYFYSIIVSYVQNLQISWCVPQTRVRDLHDWSTVERT